MFLNKKSDLPSQLSAKLKVSVFEEEIKSLCLQLKNNCVVIDGKNVESEPVKSAEIIHQLGLLHFKQSTDKISLIKSVGLLNSALVRTRSNYYEMEQDLYQVCQHILIQAKALNQTANLIHHANFVKSQIQSMRQKTNQALKFIKIKQKFNENVLQKQQKDKINSITRLQKQITANYKEIMKELCQYCVDVMGFPPCRFAVIGMGSLAREEITPYSDFEHVILLQKQDNYEIHLEYFRWFSVIYHTIVLNLQETIIPSLNIMYLNDLTCDLGDWFFDTYTSGISFDGMMPHACKFPLGRTQPTEKKPWTTELIKPVDKMLEYLNSDENLKNGYHLSDILTETCFVYGEESLYDDFVIGIQAYRKSMTRSEALDCLKYQVIEDLDKFATRIKLTYLKSSERLNVKQMFYRTSTLFVATLGKMCSTKSSSCFGIINELYEQKKITENAKHKLLFAISIACEIRLRVYANAKSQRDYIYPPENAETMFYKILKITDIKSVISYFQITYCLQRLVIKLLGINDSYIYSNASLLNITICYALRQNKLMLSLLKNYTDSRDLNTSENCADETFYELLVGHDTNKESLATFNVFDKFLSNLENEIDFASNSAGTSMSSANPKTIYNQLFIVIASLHENGELSEAIEFMKRILEIFQHPSMSDEERKKISEEEEMDIDTLVGFIQLHIASLLVELNQFSEASEQMKQVVENCNKQNHVPEYKSVLYFYNGNNFFKMRQYEQSLNHIQTALGIALSDGLDEYNKYYIMMLYSGIGACLLHMGLCKESLRSLNVALQVIEIHITEDEDDEDDDNFLQFSFNRATTYHSVGKCLMVLNLHEDALPYLHQAFHLKIKKKLENKNNKKSILTKNYPTLKRKLQEFVDILNDLGLWYMKKYRFKQGLRYLLQAFDIHKFFEVTGISETRLKILNCYMEMFQRERIEEHLKDSYKSKRDFTFIVAVDSVALTYSFQMRML